MNNTWKISRTSLKGSIGKMETLIDQTNAELERQKTLLLRSIARAQLLIEPMEIIGEKETDRIQEFIAFNIPRSPLIFNTRQKFRNILKSLSMGKIEKKQAVQKINDLNTELLKLNTVLEGVQ